MNLNTKSKTDLVNALREAGAKFKGVAVGCPWCKDENPSGSVYESEDGAWRYRCHAKCQFTGNIYDVTAKMQNKTVDELLAEEKQAKKKDAEKNAPKVYTTIADIERTVLGEVEARYQYTNPTTKTPDLVVIRYKQDGKKHFWQCSPAQGGWILKRPQGQLPLYNRIEVTGSDEVLVVEGEKCVHCCRSAGHVATTSPMGAGNGHYADWSPLAGKTCYLWPDNDEVGIRHMQEVADLLSHLEPVTRVYWINPASLGLENKQDVVDFTAKFEAELSHSAIQTVIEMAEPMGAAKELEALLEATIKGQRRCVKLPWDIVSNMTKALMPKTVSLLCGKPGGSKSFAMLQMAWKWHMDGIKWALYELEDDRAYHLGRVLAQLDQNADLTDSDWVEAHPEETRQAYRRHQREIDDFGRHLYVAPDAQVDYAGLGQWVEARAAEGCRVIAIDPVTAVSPEKEVYIADAKFLFTIKTIARSSGCSILLVTHPRKGKVVVGLDDLAGGAAFQRFIQTILWLEATATLRTATISGSGGRTDASINRILHLCKTRNGRGNGLAIGMMWEGSRLSIREEGVIVGLKKATGWNKDDV